MHGSAALIWLAATARQPPLQQVCLHDTAYACYDTDTALPVRYSDDEYNATTTEKCVQCTTDHCDNHHPATGLVCRPYQRVCTMCKDPDTTMIGDGYTVVIQPQCASRQPCSGTVAFARNITISGLTSIAFTTAPYYAATPIVAAVCPLFIFTNVAHVNISNMTIECQSTSNSNEAPAIYFEKAQHLRQGPPQTLTTVSQLLSPRPPVPRESPSHNPASLGFESQTSRPPSGSCRPFF
jgi:hypothetical protein